MPGRAEAALEAVMLLERGLHRVQRAVLGEAFDRGHIGAVRRQREHRAGLHALAVHMDRARAALAGVAANMGAGEPQIVADEIDQQRAAFDLAGHGFAVHLH